MDKFIENLPIEISGEGENALVFAHGFGGCKEDWNPYFDFFKEKACVVTFDHLGSRKIQVPDNMIDTSFSNAEFHTRVLSSIIKKSTRGKKVCLVTHSYSGLLGVKICINEPGLIDKLVLIGASPRYLNDVDYYGGVTIDVANNIFKEISDNFLDWVGDFKNAVLMDCARNEDSFQKSIITMGPKRALSIAKAIFLSDYRSELKNLDTETMVIHSTPDPVVSDEAAKFLFSNIKNVRCETIYSGGHFPHVEHFDLVSALINDFVFVKK